MHKAKAWAEAMEIFEKKTGVKVEFEKKSFEQIRQNAAQILNSDEAPDVMEYNKGNATAGLLVIPCCKLHCVNINKEIEKTTNTLIKIVEESYKSRDITTPTASLIKDELIKTLKNKKEEEKPIFPELYILY